MRLFCFAAEVDISLPTLTPKPGFQDVPAGRYHNDDDTRPLTGPAAVGLGSRDPAVGDRSVVGRQDHDATVLSPLYVGVPLACACILLSLVVLGVLLLRHGRDRHSNDRQKTVSLLLSYKTSPSSPSPLFRQEVSAIELSQSREPCICLHCNRPRAFVPTSAMYSPVETRS